MTNSRVSPWKNRIDRFIFGYALLFVAFFALVPVSFLSWPSLELGERSVSVYYLLLIISALLFSIYAAYGTFQAQNIPSYFKVMALVLASLLISSYFSQWKGSSLKASVGMWAKGMAVGVALYHVIRYKAGENKLSQWFILIGAIAAFGAIFEIMTNSFFVFERYPTQERWSDYFSPDRGIAVGAVGQPLPFSFALIALFPFAFSEALKKRNKFEVISSFLIATAVFLTYRRTGVLIILGLGLFLILRNGNIRHKKFILGSLLVFFGLTSLAIINAPQHYERFNPSVIIQELKESPRTWGFQKSVETFKQSPWLGVGPRGYERVVDHKNLEDLIYETPDNQYLRFLAEGGLLGVFSGLVLVLFSIRVLLCLYKSPGKGVWSFSLGVFLISFAFFDALYWPVMACFFWSILGASAAIRDRDRALP